MLWVLRLQYHKSSLFVCKQQGYRIQLYGKSFCQHAAEQIDESQSQMPSIFQASILFINMTMWLAVFTHEKEREAMSYKQPALLSWDHSPGRKLSLYLSSGSKSQSHH